MVTLTLAPEMHYFYDAKVRDAFSAKHKIQAANGLLSDSDLFKYRALVIGREVTKYLKRIRKRARCRYLLVAEAHSEPALRGRPHFHLLLHELEIGTLVKRHEVCEEPTKANGHRFSVGELYDHAFIRTQWEHGWTTAKRADSKSVFYLCKYLVKSLNVRVRASEKYGNDFEDKIPIERCEDRGKLITGKEKSNGAASAEMDVIGVD